MALIDDLADAYVSISSAEDIRTPNDLPRAYDLDGAKLIVPHYEGVPEALIPTGGFYMADPTPVVINSATKIFKLDFIFGAGKQGFSEGYHFALVSVNNPYDVLEEVGKKYAEARRKCAASTTNLEAFRISEVGVRNDSLPRRDPKLGLGVGAVATAPAPYDQGVAMVAYDASNKIRSRHQFCGFALADLNISTDASRTRPGYTAAVTKFYGALRKLLKENQAPTNGGSCRAVIPSYDRSEDAGRNPMHDIQAWGKSSQGLLQVTMPPTFPGTQGDVYHLSHMRDRVVRRLSGSYAIHKVEPITGSTNLLVTLRARTCYPVENLKDLVGWLQGRAVEYFEVSELLLAGYGERVIGRAFFAQVGHQSAGC